MRRKAAGSIRVHAHGRAAHSGSAPDKGVNALLALADVASVVAGCHDPQGADRLTAVPTILRSGEALNVVPADGELVCDVRADRLEALRGVLAAIPEEARGARIEARMQREWPGMDARAAIGAGPGGRRRGARAAGCAPRSAAARATRATSRRRSRSRSTGSAHAADTPTIPTNSWICARCGPARR